MSIAAALLLAIVPSVACSKEIADIQQAVDVYEGDLPSSELVCQEFKRWKLR